MAVKVAKKKDSTPPVSGIETNMPAANSADPRPLETNRIESNELKRQTGDQGGLRGTSPGVAPGKRAHSVTITFPSSSFAPVRYGSFAIPAVSLEIGLEDEENEETQETSIDHAILYLQQLQDRLFKSELEAYVKRAKIAHKAVCDELGEA